jgi:hypothetical protein
MVFQPPKCKNITIGGLTNHDNYYMKDRQGREIKKELEVKDLGIIVDHKLTFSNHYHVKQATRQIEYWQPK